MKTFKGKLDTIIFSTFADSPDTTLEFTKNQIKIPEHLKGKFFVNYITNGVAYKLIEEESIESNTKYKVSIQDGDFTTISNYPLIVDKSNEKKLRKIHGLDKTYFEEHPTLEKVFIAILGGIVSLAVGLALLQYKERQQTLIDSKQDSVSIHQNERLDSIQAYLQDSPGHQRKDTLVSSRPIP